MEQADQRDREIRELRERLSRLSEASIRINESLDFETVLQGVLDSARSLTGAGKSSGVDLGYKPGDGRCAFFGKPGISSYPLAFLPATSFFRRACRCFSARFSHLVWPGIAESPQLTHKPEALRFSQRFFLIFR